LSKIGFVLSKIGLGLGKPNNSAKIWFCQQRIAKICTRLALLSHYVESNTNFIE